MRCTDFHTEYGMWSGSGAEVFEDLARALDISSVVRGVYSSSNYCDFFSFSFFF